VEARLPFIITAVVCTLSLSGKRGGAKEVYSCSKRNQKKKKNLHAPLSKEVPLFFSLVSSYGVSKRSE
jgi:hypothetical protein